MEWRQIESDWLGAAGTLALQLDSDTNNTSLALAIELSPGGKVLLFPGDAQVGNWLSWHALHWTREGEPERSVDAADLLRRTAFYKVGHHASHNATLREKGLELMDAAGPGGDDPGRRADGAPPQGGEPRRLGHALLPAPGAAEGEDPWARAARRHRRAGRPRTSPTPADREAFAPGRIETPLYLEITIPA